MSNDVLFVSCTRGRKEDTELFRSLSRLTNIRAEMLFFENNIEGLSARYNSVLDRANTQERLVVFAHDDLLINEPLLLKKLGETAGAVIGLVGSDAFSVDATLPFLMWEGAGRPHLSGQITLGTPSNRINAFYGPSPRPVTVIDGMFIAVRPQLLNGVRFDERFTFHFYDLDFCLSANDAGLAISTAPSIAARHITNYHVTINNRPFMEAQQLFRAKWHGRTFQI